MAVALVQTAQFAGTANNTSATFTLASAPTVGNLLIFIATFGANDGPAVTPSGWTSQAQYTTANTGYNESVSVYSRIVQSGDGTSWTLAYDTVADNANAGFLLEVSGQASTGYFNKIATGGASGTPSPFTTASVTPTVTGCLAIAAFGNSGSGGTNTATFSSGWVQDQYANASYQPGWLSHRSALTTDTTTAITDSITSMNGGGNNSASVIMLIAPSGGAPATPTNLFFTMF